jgi:hypothetical protein
MPSQDIARSLSVGKGAVDGVIYGHTMLTPAVGHLSGNTAYGTFA